MKLSHLLPLIVISAVSLLPACEYDKVTTTVEYYTSDEYHTLKEKLNLPSTPFNYNPFFFEHSGIDQTGTLGRVLFYDTNLSSDNTVSCSSCHQQNLGFADNKAFSTGIMNRSTARNALSLGAFKSFDSYTNDPETTLFWDGRVNTLHDQMIQTIRNPKEMGMEMSDIVAKVKDQDYYKILSKKAFGTDEIDENIILRSLESFMNSISAQSSKFDMAPTLSLFNGTITLGGFNSQENLGANLFKDNCVTCHSQGLEKLNFSSHPNAQTLRKANNGLDLVYTDKGEGEFNPAPEALAIFKIPGLHNIELTAPYMHDGRFKTLEEVVNFYSTGIQDHPNLNPLLKENGHAKKFNFSVGEKDALVQFLKTLTDPQMALEEKWSDPFL